MDAGQGDSIVLEEEIDPNYEPSEKEVIEYATWLGMDLEAEKDLFWIAREGLKAPLPEDWKPCKTTDTGEIYYFNFTSGESTWDHPCDEFYRNLYAEHKKKRVQSTMSPDTDDRKQKEKEDVAELLGKKKSGSKKKKRQVLAPATQLAPPTLGTLEKKPLPGLSNVRSLNSSLSGLADTKLSHSLGKIGNNDEVKGIERKESLPEPLALNALAKPVLGNVRQTPSVGALPSSTPRTSLGDQTTIQSSFNDQKQGLEEDLTRQKAELEEKHQEEVAKMQKKFEDELLDLEQEADNKRKSKKRELDRKLNDIEDEFDKKENNLRREWKDKLKKLEVEMKSQMEERSRTLGKEMAHEVELEQKSHDKKLQDMRNKYEKEEKELKASLVQKVGEMKSMNELGDQVSRLKNIIESTKDELERTQRVKSNEMQLLQEKYDATVVQAKELQKQLDGINIKSDVDSVPVTCGKCGELQEAMNKLKTEWEEKELALNGEVIKHKEKIEEVRQNAEQQIEEIRQNAEKQIEEMQGLETNLVDTKAREDALTEKLLESEKQVAECKTEIEALRFQLSEATNAASVNAEALSDAGQSDINDMQVQIQTQQATIRSLEEQIVSFKEELSTREVSIEQNNLSKASPSDRSLEEEAIRAVTVERDGLLSQVEDLREENSVLETTNEQIKQQLLKESRECGRLRDLCDSKEGEMSKINAQMQEFQQKIARLETEAARNNKQEVEQQVENENESIKRLEQECEKLKKQITDQQVDLEKAKIELDTAELQMQEMKAKIEKDGSNTTQMKMEKDELQIKIDTLSTENDSLTNSMRELEDVMLKLKESHSQVTTQNSILESKCQEHEEEVQKQLAEVSRLVQELEIQKKNGNEKALVVSNLRTDVEMLEKQLDESQRMLREVRSQTSKAMKDGESVLRYEMTSLETRLEEAQDQISSLAKEKARLEQRCSLLSEERDGGSNQILQLEVEVDRLKKMEKEYEHASIRLKQAQVDKDELIMQLDAEKASVVRLENEKRNMEKTAVTLNAKLKELQAQKDDAESSQKDKEEQVRKLTSELKRLQGGTSMVEWQVKMHEEAEQELESKVAALEQANWDKSTSIKALKRELEEYRNKAELIESDKGDVETKVQMLESHIKSLNWEIQELTRKKSEVDEQFSILEEEKEQVNKKLEDLGKKRSEDTSKIQHSTTEVERLSDLLRREKTKTKELELNLNVLEKKLVDVRKQTAIDAVMLESQKQSIGHHGASNQSETWSSNAFGKRELEEQFESTSSQLDVSLRRIAAMEMKCREQALEIDSLTAELASVRHACDKLHTSALEALPFMERAEYEREKQVIRRDHAKQLRFFRDREEKAFERNKSRLHENLASSLEDLTLDLEKRRRSKEMEEERQLSEKVEDLRKEYINRLRDEEMKLSSDFFTKQKQMRDRNNDELKEMENNMARKSLEGKKENESRQAHANDTRLSDMDDQMSLSDGSESLKSEGLSTPKAIAKGQKKLLKLLDTMIVQCRRELNAERKELKKRKCEWDRNCQRTGRSRMGAALLKEMKEQIDHDTKIWRRKVKDIKDREAWLKRTSNSPVEEGYFTDNQSCSDEDDWMDNKRVNHERDSFGYHASQHNLPAYNVPDIHSTLRSYVVDPFPRPIQYVVPSNQLSPVQYQSSSPAMYSSPMPVFSSRSTSQPIFSGVNIQSTMRKRETPFRSQITKWADDRKRVHGAASQQLAWLSRFRDQVTEYESKYKGDQQHEEIESELINSADKEI